MEITEVKVFPVRDKKLRAFASIVFDAAFMVNDIKIIEGKDGLFISMPSRRKKNGRFKDIAHPLNQETRQVLEERIIAEYRRVAAGDQEDRPASVARVEPRREAGEPTGSAEEAAAPGGETREQPGESESQAAGTKSLEEVAEDHLSDSYWTT